MLPPLCHMIDRESPMEARREPKKVRGRGHQSILSWPFPFASIPAHLLRRTLCQNGRRLAGQQSGFKIMTNLTSDSLRAGTDTEPLRSVAGEADQPSGEQPLPLLRLSGWDNEKQYDKHSPVCIHYDFQWKISQREKIRARRVFSDTDTDLVLAPSDF